MFDQNTEPNWPPILLGIIIFFGLVWLASLSDHPGGIIITGIVIFALASFAKRNC